MATPNNPLPACPYADLTARATPCRDRTQLVHMIMLRFIFALAVHTATTSAATVSVKDGADEGHRQLSDCRQRQGHNPITGSCCNFCDNPGNGVDKPWWSPGANAKCDRDDLACAGCSECKTNCRQREGHDQRTGSCCNFCDNPGNGVDKPWKVGANAKCHRDDIACSSCSQCEGCRQDVKNQGEDISSWRSRVHERQRQLALCLPSARLLAGCPHAQGKRHAQSHVGAMLTVAHVCMQLHRAAGRLHLHQLLLVLLVHF